MSNENKNMMVLKCDKCNKEYQISRKSFKQRQRRNNPNLCFDCMKKYAVERTNKTKANMSPERKALYSQRLSEANKEVWEKMDPETKELRFEQLRQQSLNIANNSTPEQVKARIEKGLKTKANFSDEKKKEISDKISKGLKEHWDNLTPEAREAFSNLMKEVMANLPSESKQCTLDGWSTWWNSLSDEERQIRINNLLKSRDDYYSNISYNERVENEQKQCILKNKESKEYTDYLIKNRIQNVKGTEGEFMKILYENNIEFIFQFYNIFPDQNFHKLFPNNIITGSNYVSPFHRWDFLIHTKQKDILVDIDGSIHDEIQTDYYRSLRNGEKIMMSVVKSFYDSQRKYQTDNSPAYIIQCYDDKLTLDNKVINIYDDNDSMSLEEFINIIKEYNK